MAIVGWLVALLLGIVLALFSVGNQQPATINVLGASYQNIPIWVVMLASAALGALMAIVISLVDRVRWYMASRFTKKVLTEHKKMIIDRKSTRLNSSHSQISYAVFCLKKKTYT